MLSLDLFAGMGGLSIGLEQAGIKTLMCVDKDRAAVRTMLAAGLPAVQADVKRLTLDRGRIPDLICGGPPCQPYSLSGRRRGEDDPRDCVPTMVSIVQEIRPTWVLMENVRGMQGRMQQVKTTISDLYSSVQIIHMNAEDCGLAQRRRRIFLVAGPAPIRQPLASTVKISMGEALGISIDRPGPGPIYPKGLGRAATEPQWLGRPSPTVMTTEVKGTRANARSCWTFNGGPDRVSDALFLALGRRRASIEECMILQGFPQDMVMCGTVEDKYRLLGNAVPPPMARMIGEEILKVHMGL